MDALETEQQVTDMHESTAATAVIVHYGDVSPSIKVAESAATWAQRVIVVANDGLSRPTGLTAPVEWIVPDRNLGYGGAVNVAISQRTTGALVVLNPDIELPPDVARRCLSALEIADVGVLSPQLQDPRGVLQPMAGSVSRITSRIHRTIVTAEAGLIECDWVPGAIMFIKGPLVDKIGFAENYFLGFEDVDYCLRARALGYRTVVAASEAATHVGAATIGSARWRYFEARNSIWFARDNRGHLAGALALAFSSIRFIRVLGGDAAQRHRCTHSRMTALGIRHSFSRRYENFLPKPDLGIDSTHRQVLDIPGS